MDTMPDINLGTGTAIPDSILLQIFSYLPFYDLCKAAQVCCLWRRVALDNSLRITIDIRAKPIPEPRIRKLILSQCGAVLHDLKFRGSHSKVHFCGGSTCVGRGLIDPTLSPACLDMLEKCAPHLRCLTIENGYIGRDSSVNNFCIFPQSVEHLSLHGSMFPRHFKFPSNLVCLNLGYSGNMKCEDLQAVTNAPRLKFLCLDNCRLVTNKGVDHLRPILPQLQVLNLEATAISDAGVVILFQNCVAIEELYIGHTYDKVTNSALKFLKLGQMPKLSKMCAARSRMTSDMDVYITRRVPSLRFLTLGCKGDEQMSCHHLKHKCPVIRDKNTQVC